MSEIQVLARVTCPRSDCSGGKVYAPVIHTGLGPAPPLERDCDTCGGDGYVEEWFDLARLVEKVVRFA